MRVKLADLLSLLEGANDEAEQLQGMLAQASPAGAGGSSSTARALRGVWGRRGPLCGCSDVKKKKEKEAAAHGV